LFSDCSIYVVITIFLPFIPELADISELLGGDPEIVGSSLITRTVETRRGRFSVHLNAREAETTKRTLCQVLYGRLFTWLLARINHELKLREPQRSRILSIVDMYGFCPSSESHNGLHQLAINYASEKLHQAVNQWTLYQEQEELNREGLQEAHPQPVDFADHSSVCSLVDHGGHGLLALLDEARHSAESAGQVRGGSINSEVAADVFTAAVAERLAQHPRLTMVDVGEGVGDVGAERCFRIRHFGGEITYCAADFVEHNQNFLHLDVSRAMFSCQHPILKQLFAEGTILIIFMLRIMIIAY